MGNSRWRHADWTLYSSDSATKSATASDLYKSRQLQAALDVKKFSVRESRDSEKNPQSTAIMVALDVTGSMGFIAAEMAKNSLGELFQLILDNKPVTDPHVMFLGIGDCVAGDRAPVQATQFEADNVLLDQLRQIYLEGGGGGNQYESYELAWLVAALKTDIDCWNKRNKKGYVFTIGDECFPQKTDMSYVQSVFGEIPAQHTTPQSFLNLCEQRYNAFHIIISQGDFASRELPRVVTSWRAVMNRKALVLTDYKLMPQLIETCIQITEQCASSAEEVCNIIDRWQNPHITTVLKAAILE